MPRHQTKTSFKKGRIAHNRQDLYIDCLQCGKKVKTIKSRKNKHRFCGKKCGYEHRKQYSKRNKIVSLYKQGKKYREIADLMGMKIGSVCHYTYTSRLKERFGDNIIGFSHKEAVRTKLDIDECELCGFNRIIEVAHVIEAKNGGKYTTDNCLILCPNHHSLFDRNLLNEEEKTKLSNIKRIILNIKKRYVTFS